MKKCLRFYKKKWICGCFLLMFQYAGSFVITFLHSLANLNPVLQRNKDLSKFLQLS